MLKSFGYVLISALLTLSIAACDRGGNEGGSGAGAGGGGGEQAGGEQGGGETAEPTIEQRLVGTWANEAMPEATMTFASNGRMRTSFGPCVGTYTVDGETVAIDYEESPNCMDMSGRISFPSNDRFSMSMTNYNRVDSTDDTSF